MQVELGFVNHIFLCPVNVFDKGRCYDDKILFGKQPNISSYNLYFSKPLVLGTSQTNHDNKLYETVLTQILVFTKIIYSSDIWVMWPVLYF